MPAHDFHGHGTSPHLSHFIFCAPSGVYPRISPHVSLLLPSTPFHSSTMSTHSCQRPRSSHSRVTSSWAQLRSPHPLLRSAPTARSSQRQLGVSISESLCAADLIRACVCIARPNLRHMRSLWPSKRRMPHLCELLAALVRSQTLTVWICCSYLPRLPQVRRRLRFLCHSCPHSPPLLGPLSCSAECKLCPFNQRSQLN
jgi:hypothetical protein